MKNNIFTIFLRWQNDKDFMSLFVQRFADLKELKELERSMVSYLNLILSEYYNIKEKLSFLGSL